MSGESSKRGVLVGVGVVLLLGLGDVVGYWGCDRSIVCGAVRFFVPRERGVMTAKKLYHRLYARVVRARLRWSVQPPVFFARRRYWLTSVVAVVVLIGAAVSVLAWRSHEERQPGEG